MANLPVTDLGTGLVAAQNPLYLRKWAEESRAYWDHMDPFQGINFSKKSVSGADSISFPYYGQMKPVNFELGMNTEVEAQSTDALNRKVNQAMPHLARVVQLDKMSLLQTVITKTDEIQAMDGTLARMHASHEVLEALMFGWTLKRISAISNGATFPDSGLKVGIPTKTAAGTLAGISDGVVGSDYVGATLLTDGGVAEAALGRAQLFMNFEHVPQSGRYALCDPRIPFVIARQSGMQISSSNAAPVSKTLNRDFGGMGSIVNNSVPEVAGFKIIPCPYLSLLGTNMESLFGTTLTSKPESRYMPNVVADTWYTLNGVQSLIGGGGATQVLDVGNGATNPTAWTGAAHNAKTYYDGLSIVCFHESALGIANGIDLTADPSERWGLMGIAYRAFMQAGAGPISPESVVNILSIAKNTI